MMNDTGLIPAIRAVGTRGCLAIAIALVVSAYISADAWPMKFLAQIVAAGCFMVGAGLVVLAWLDGQVCGPGAVLEMIGAFVHTV